MMDINSNCVAICTKLRNMGFDEHGVLSVIPDPLLIDVLGHHIRDDGTYTECLARIVYTHKHLLDHGYLERVESGYRLTGEDMVGD